MRGVPLEAGEAASAPAIRIRRRALWFTVLQLSPPFQCMWNEPALEELAWLPSLCESGPIRRECWCGTIRRDEKETAQGRSVPRRFPPSWKLRSSRVMVDVSWRAGIRETYTRAKPFPQWRLSARRRIHGGRYAFKRHLVLYMMSINTVSHAARLVQLNWGAQA